MPLNADLVTGFCLRQWRSAAADVCRNRLSLHQASALAGVFFFGWPLKLSITCQPVSLEWRIPEKRQEVQVRKPAQDPHLQSLGAKLRLPEPTCGGQGRAPCTYSILQLPQQQPGMKQSMTGDAAALAAVKVVVP